jgi:DNA-directed RNA polymerase specialized sigma24 family protein
MVQRIVTCREDAEEVYQDVFFKALRSIGGFDSRQASLATWLKSIAYHYVVELYDSGSASIRVRSLNRDPISFDGSLDITY